MDAPILGSPPFPKNDAFSPSHATNSLFILWMLRHPQPQSCGGRGLHRQKGPVDPAGSTG